MSLTIVSANSKTPWISASSVSSNMPFSFPSFIKYFISSSDTNALSSKPLAPKIFSTRLVDIVRNFTNPEAILDKKSMGLAEIHASSSAYLRASDFGISSPNMSVT